MLMGRDNWKAARKALRLAASNTHTAGAWLRFNGQPKLADEAGAIANDLRDMACELDGLFGE